MMPRSSTVATLCAAVVSGVTGMLVTGALDAEAEEADAVAADEAGADEVCGADDPDPPDGDALADGAGPVPPLGSPPDVVGALLVVVCAVVEPSVGGAGDV
jgi:hypothetical protein